MALCRRPLSRAGTTHHKPIGTTLHKPNGYSAPKLVPLSRASLPLVHRSLRRVCVGRRALLRRAGSHAADHGAVRRIPQLDAHQAGDACASRSLPWWQGSHWLHVLRVAALLEGLRRRRRRKSRAHQVAAHIASPLTPNTATHTKWPRNRLPRSSAPPPSFSLARPAPPLPPPLAHHCAAKCRLNWRSPCDRRSRSALSHEWRCVQALAHFALERTELALGRKKIQGVDTPSQRRYIHQLDALLRAQHAYLPGTEGDLDEGGRATGSSRLAQTAQTPLPPATPMEPSSPQPESALVETADPESMPGSQAALGDGRPHVIECEGGGASPTPAPRGGTAALAAELGTVQLPACPRLLLTSLCLRGWYAKPPKGPLVCAVHLNGVVVAWSTAVLVAACPSTAAAAAQVITFELNSAPVAGDVRVSVFDLDALLAERGRRSKRGLSPRLPFDRAVRGPWEADSGDSLGDAEAGVHAVQAEGRSAGGDVTKRVVAGKEVGCKFFMLFHTGFVSADGALPVPLQMMDKAFKNKKQKYCTDGVATLHFKPAESA